MTRLLKTPRIVMWGGGDASHGVEIKSRKPDVNR